MPRFPECNSHRRWPPPLPVSGVCSGCSWLCTQTHSRCGRSRHAAAAGTAGKCQYSTNQTAHLWCSVYRLYQCVHAVPRSKHCCQPNCGQVLVGKRRARGAIPKCHMRTCEWKDCESHTGKNWVDRCTGEQLCIATTTGPWQELALTAHHTQEAALPP